MRWREMREIVMGAAADEPWAAARCRGGQQSTVAKPRGGAEQSSAEPVGGVEQRREAGAEEQSILGHSNALCKHGLCRPRAPAAGALCSKAQSVSKNTAGRYSLM